LEVKKCLDLQLAIAIANGKAIAILLDGHELIASGQK
jgi:hypothetical protein